jgi:hypothetical protein
VTSGGVPACHPYQAQGVLWVIANTYEFSRGAVPAGDRHLEYRSESK